VKADRSGQLRGFSGEQFSAERMENIRLGAELARVTMERDQRQLVLLTALTALTHDSCYRADGRCLNKNVTRSRWAEWATD
jgi:hypothetical protein